MSILIDEKTRVLIQGITGKEGSKAAMNMKAYGTKVVAGVTPGKGGETVEGVPVYNSVKEAMKKHPEINTSLIFVPPIGTKDAALEAINNGIKIVNIVTEKMPIADSAYLHAYAKRHNAIVVGSSSVGIISPGKAKTGPIGGSNPDRVYTKGDIGLISKSGGMCSETSLILKQNGLGESTVIGMGGDMIVGSNFADLIKMFEKDKETKAIVMFGEFGGTYEEEVAELVKKGEVKKPIVAFIVGHFAEFLPGSLQLGHAGAIIEGKRGTAKSKVEALEKAGVLVAKVHSDIPVLLKKALK